MEYDIPYGDGTTRSLVLDFFDLPMSERRAIAEWAGVKRTHPMERDFDYHKRLFIAVRDAGKVVEFAGRVALAKSRHSHS